MTKDELLKMLTVNGPVEVDEEDIDEHGIVITDPEEDEDE